MEKANDVINIMEVCGTHTMSIARSGIKGVLPENIKLISGPGCPVCVTPAVEIDAFLKLSQRKDVIIASYGDMLKVPGSVRGDSLKKRRADGAQIEVVYSPVDAVELAERKKEKEIVFLGVGFETTAPGTAAAIKTAHEKNIKNFSVFTMLKSVKPALCKLISSPGFNVNGFLCPGHVAVITGEEGFKFLEDEFHIPSVIAGFEPEEILKALKMLTEQIIAGRTKLENCYKDVVSFSGNEAAKKIIDEVFEMRDSSWRGMGMITSSGFAIKQKFSDHDAIKKFEIGFEDEKEDGSCRCGDVICGWLSPPECPLFGRECTPNDPLGPCMVSGEGSCAAAYLYGEGKKRNG